MLKDRIQDDLKSAMIAKDELATSTIRMLKSALQYYEIQRGGAGYSGTDEDVIEVVAREIKKRRESIEAYQNAGRIESVERETTEMNILQKYLPEQMSENEVRVLINEAIKKTGATTISDMGKVIGALMPATKGKADGGMVSSIVKEKLTS